MSSIPDVLLKLSREKRALLAAMLPPLSFAQQRMWFLVNYQPESSYYRIRAAVQLTGPLNIPALTRSFTESFRRHEVLRTNFAMLEDRLIQFVNPAKSCTVPVIDLSDLPADRRLAQARWLADQESQRSFDLANDQLIRIGLLRLGHDEHVLLLTMHHIIGDAWSTGVLIQELSVLYDAYSQGIQSPLSELKFQYGDYSIWQRDWFQGEVLERELGYWQRQLSGAPPVLDLPADRPRPSVPTYRGEHLTIRLPQLLTKQIKALGQAETVTSFMLLFTAFQIFLYRYTGQEDICVGTPIAGRNRVELEGLIGLFVNTLVIRTELSGEQSFREVLAHVRDRAFEAFAHQDLPFEKLVEVLQPERQLGRAPLFQVMFSLQNATTEAPRMHDLQLDFWKHDTGMSQFDLMLTIVEADRFQFTIEYSCDLFDESTIVRMFGHFQNLLEGIVQAPDTQIGRLPLLSDAERRQIVEQWNQTAADYPRDAAIHTLFEKQVLRTPNAVAVLGGDVQLTYAELNVRANQLAHYLRSSGVGPEVLVGVCLERSVDMIVGLLGILKAGGAYVPLDPSYPLQRLSAMLEDSQVPILLATEETLDILPAHWGQIVCLDTDWTMIAAESEENLVSGAAAENLAYVIYTSGSTGKPKGVSIPHRAVNRLVINSHYITLTPEDVVAQISNSSFDAATFEIWGALLNGARLVILARETTLAPRELAQQIAANNIGTIFLTTALFNQVAREAPTAFSNMRNVLFGGEQVEPKWVEAVLNHGGPQRLLHVYGPTETTTFASWHENTEVTLGQTVPIGKPIANTQLYLLDKDFQPVPSGVLGELYIGGDGLARGYLHSPELTVERMVPNPFSSREGEFMYRTGDVARQRPNGDIEFVGRIDNQIKMRGFRIELGEIETLLGQRADVSECVVVMHTSISGDKRLVAYVVPSRNAELAAGELRGYLEARLPEYMVPSWYVFLDEMPLTPNGKVARSELPEPDSTGPLVEGTYVAPRSVVEEMLAGIWSEVLGIARISINDDFFELGGHSLLATQVISRVREAFAVELPLRQLFEFPTIGGLARQVEELERLEHGLEAPPLLPVARDRDLPLSFAQQRLWFLDQLQPNSAVYNVGIAVRLRGPLNVALLEQTLTEIVRRHESLRTTFAVSAGAPVQIISKPQPMHLAIVDLTDLSNEQREEEARRLVAVENQQPFDLANGPLLRVGLLRLADADHVFPLTVHHIISDGWSLDVLVHEVATLFAAFRNGTKSPLPELTVQYADFAVWQKDWLQGEILERQFEYWRRQLAGAPPILELPTDKPRPPVQSFRGAHESIRLDRQVTEALRELSRREGGTLFMTLLAAWQMLLSRFTGQNDIVVGTPIAGRNRLEIEPLIGFFVNTLVLRTNLAGNPSFRQVVKQVREVVLGAYAHQDLPFEKLVEELQPERSLSHTPVFQVAISFHNTPQQELGLADLELSGMESENLTAKFDLTLTLSESDEAISSALVYNTDLFETATAKRLLAQYAQVLQSIVSDPDLKLSELPLLSESERNQLVVQFNETAVDYGSEGLVHEQFEEVAGREWGVVAVVSGSESLRYGELNERANQLARYLRGLGVGAEVLVGVYLERGIELVVAELAILKSGGAYMPLEMSYPGRRLSYMLEDAGVGVLITKAGVGAEVRVPAGVRVIKLEEVAAELKQESSANLAVAVRGEQMAYVIYTSGSTGQPKGVMIEQRELANLNEWHGRAYELGVGDRVTQLASAGFDAAVWETWPALSRGASLYVVTDEVRGDVERLARWLGAAGITVSFVPTPVAELLLSMAWPAATQLRVLLTGGDQLHRYSGEVGFAVVNHYGPTEATVLITSGAVARRARVEGELPGIGRPIANTQVYVLNEQQQVAPLGVVGELYLGGAGVGRGYLGRAELTAERFVPDGVSGRSGERLYRSGDLGRYRSDGELEYLGRMDEQVKIRGFRIELGEIEAALREHPSIREAAVIAAGDQPETKTLVAYLVPDRGAVLPTTELSNYLATLLPDYMIPASFLVLDALPLTENGKVDRRRLPAPVLSDADMSGSDADPRNPIETEVARIWAEVLKLPKIGIHANFFALGGHSLLATQIISRVRETFQVDLPLRSIFEMPTVAHLAAALTQSQSRSETNGGDIAHSLDHNTAADLLTRLDELSDEQVYELLDEMTVDEAVRR